MVPISAMDNALPHARGRDAAVYHR
jgi:hypothetical protein